MRKLLVLALIVLPGCNAEHAVIGPAVAPSLACTGYPVESASPYRLPYAVGEAYLVTQGNCSMAGSTHHPGSVYKYGYDVRMPRGTPILAARAGIVSDVEDRYADFNGIPFEANYVFVQHDDGSIARYFHLTLSGVRVTAGSQVEAGDLLGLSGATGLFDDPHLHFDVVPRACPARDCTTVPVTFNNTRRHPGGLLEGESYQALAQVSADPGR